jgi:malate dehydrogenase
MVEAILGDQNRVIPCGCYLEGEYGQQDIMIGVPAVIGRKGIEKIVKIELTKEEQAQFEASSAAVRKVNQILFDTKVL